MVLPPASSKNKELRAKRLLSPYFLRAVEPVLINMFKVSWGVLRSSRLRFSYFLFTIDTLLVTQVKNSYLKSNVFFHVLRLFQI